MAPERDDRVFPATHLLGAVIVPFLLVAFEQRFHRIHVGFVP